MAVSSATTVIRRFGIQIALIAWLAFLTVGCSDQPAPVVSQSTNEDAVDAVPNFQPPAQPDLGPLQLPSVVPQLADRQTPVDVVQDVSAATRIRLADDRPEINSARLQQAGINIYRGKRLVILSDLPEQQVGGLPQLADGLFEALEAYFGQLPDAADGSPFQVTGHIIGDEEKFRQAALLPSAAFTFEHGKHVNYEFWMFNPQEDYYRRHLMLHEFTHCFMTCESGMHDIPPLWYIEGMAELFATHRQSDAPATTGWQFGILPDRFDGFEGWGRISEFRRSFAQAGAPRNAAVETLKIASLSEVMPDTVPVFDSGFQYCSSWALCWFLNNHPRHRESMKTLAAIKRNEEFIDAAWTFRRSVEPALSIDWLLFAESLREGFDSERAFAVHHDVPTPLSSINTARPATFQLRADRGWQDSGLRMNLGETVMIHCSGRFSVDNQPKDWMSEPNGVSVEYVDGLPLGQVVAVLVDRDGTKLTSRISVGESQEIVAPFESSLWLQTNDASNSRANNSGVVDVTLTPSR